ncbi:glycosyltransferase family 2 protein [Croceimicrobium hydrocarbonivorans]|uniref:Glycosyltransferase n=1 Tax=Croceimicrobium hydrocarbonivorans TaxID=2761580 RepID=A0A7H0VC36_9FLAO|nr:glycosyltransferase [Croceimicrobium hydrocarbonivorans]QNR23284.1 glycosyltransferase [Croceimicrobium hydrocarbonivorans]
MKQPFFSVIIPAYEAIDTLEDCLDSVWSQSFSDYEIILTDDGSSDGSGAFAEKWLEEKAVLRYHIIEQENKGLGAARNAAIAAASGKFCALLDADDLWHPEKLSACYDFLKSAPETAVLYHSVENFGRNHNRRPTFPIKSLKDLILLGCPLVPSASIIRRDLALEHPFQTNLDYHGAEDLYLWLELLIAGEQLHYWPEALSYYREEGGMSSNIDEHLFKVNNVYEHFYQENHISKQDFERATQRKYYEAARFYQKGGKHDKAQQFYSVADAKSLKILGLRILNALGLSI